ncbi:uncharacterized protein LOC141537359 isoform X2 [Cotesia typhae]|uniref:uncharacterized protein LOC141537359 isoform X2 n=1 Tax=Cotesia typhae TaxID=2053667 RepID=UPI003D6896E4
MQEQLDAVQPLEEPSEPEVSDTESDTSQKDGQETDLLANFQDEESVEEKENDDQNKIRDQKTDPIPPSLNAEQASCIKTLSEEVLKVLSEDPLA